MRHLPWKLVACALIAGVLTFLGCLGVWELRHSSALSPMAVSPIRTIKAPWIFQREPIYNHLEFSPDEKLLTGMISMGHPHGGFFGMHAGVWQSADGKLLAAGPIGGEHEFRSYRVAFSQTGKVFATYEAKVVQVRDAATGKVLREHAFDQPLREVCFSTKGDLVAALEGDDAATIIDIATGKTVGTGPLHLEKWGGARWKERFLVKYDATGVTVWETASGNSRHVDLDSHSLASLSLAEFPYMYTPAISPDGSTLAVWSSVVGGAEHTASGPYERSGIVVFDVSSQTELARFPGGQCAAFTPDGKTLAIMKSGGSLEFWATPTLPTAADGPETPFGSMLLLGTIASAVTLAAGWVWSRWGG